MAMLQRLKILGATFVLKNMRFSNRKKSPVDYIGDNC